MHCVLFIRVQFRILCEQYQLLNQLIILSINKKLSFENQLKKFYKFLQNKRMLLKRHGAVYYKETIYKLFVSIAYDIDNLDCNLKIQNIDVNIVNRLTFKSNSGAQFVQDYPLNGQIVCSLEVVNTKTPGFLLTPSTT
ncbi:unnamed protein product [Paramecium octaurelia]|uniref:Uncharacterized protein n=1 Tax=Paramecium octaurelia TaxID=43137 RepID=A0A8S1V1A1_PAROT|nr:unnamed protein product [Paramecium octaurelia]